MTDDRIALCALLEKSSDADLLREMIGFAAERLMGLEVQALTGAAYGERSPNRLAPTRHPNDSRARRDVVLGLMVAQGRVEQRAADRARNTRVPTRSHPAATIDARYFRDFVVKHSAPRAGSRGAAIYTTLDAALQRSAERSVTRGLARLGRSGVQAALYALATCCVSSKR